MPTSGEKIWGPEKIYLNKHKGESLFVGRSLDSMILISHPGVSKKHAKITIKDDVFKITDLGSSFGTRVNGQQIREQIIQQGDRIEFGPVPYELIGTNLVLIKNNLGASLKTCGMKVVRGQHTLLENVNFQIMSNSFVGVIGQSGSGKTSLIKCLASFFNPESGIIYFDDLFLEDNINFYRSIIGYVPQEDVIYPNLTARENLDYALRIRLAIDFDRKESLGMVESVISDLGLENHADKPVFQLSGGQKKRVNVGIELLSKPRILFLDEPTSGLDPSSENRVMFMLKKLAAKGTTIICSTHSMQNIQLFDQIIVVANKTVVYSDNPSGLLKFFDAPDYSFLYSNLESPLIKNSATTDKPTPEEKNNDFITKILGGHSLVQMKKPNEIKNLESFSGIKNQGLIKINYNTNIKISPFFNQVRMLTERGLKVTISDKWFTFLLFFQPIIIGLLINLSQSNPNKGTDNSAIFLFGIVASIWIGLNNSAREIIRDRSIYVRERFAGITPEGYLASKALLFATIGFFQVIVLVFVIRQFNSLPLGDANDLCAISFYFMVCVFMSAYLSSMFLGFFISTISNSEETAIGFLPILVLPQLLLSKVASNIRGSDNSFGAITTIFSNNEDYLNKGIFGWLLEFVSCFTYSRPASDLFRRTNLLSIDTMVDLIHILFLLFGTLTLLIIVFNNKERDWIEEKKRSIIKDFGIFLKDKVLYIYNKMKA